MSVNELPSELSTWAARWKDDEWHAAAEWYADYKWRYGKDFSRLLRSYECIANGIDVLLIVAQRRSYFFDRI